MKPEKKRCCLLQCVKCSAIWIALSVPLVFCLPLFAETPKVEKLTDYVVYQGDRKFCQRFLENPEKIEHLKPVKVEKEWKGFESCPRLFGFDMENYLPNLEIAEAYHYEVDFDGDGIKDNLLEVRTYISHSLQDNELAYRVDLEKCTAEEITRKARMAPFYLFTFKGKAYVSRYVDKKQNNFPMHFCTKYPCEMSAENQNRCWFMILDEAIEFCSMDWSREIEFGPDKHLGSLSERTNCEYFIDMNKLNKEKE